MTLRANNLNTSQSNVANAANVLNDLNDGIIKILQGPVYKRIPKASRLQAYITFTKLVQNVINKNDRQSWENLLNFARCAIGSSVQVGKKKKSKATILNKMSSPIPKIKERKTSIIEKASFCKNGIM